MVKLITRPASFPAVVGMPQIIADRSSRALTQPAVRQQRIFNSRYQPKTSARTDVPHGQKEQQPLMVGGQPWPLSWPSAHAMQTHAGTRMAKTDKKLSIQPPERET